MLFPTTIAGSLPKPEWLAEPNMLWAPWKAKGEELARAKRDATMLAVKLQEDAGVDIVTEGEMARQHFVHGFLEKIEGIDFAHKVEMGIRNDRYKAMVPQVVAPLALKGRVHADEARVARTHTKNKLKFTLPGPMTIIDTIADRYYGDRVKMAFAFAELLNQEAKALQADGVDVIQFDEPAFNVYMDEVRDWGIKALETRRRGADLRHRRAHLLRLRHQGQHRLEADARRRVAAIRGDVPVDRQELDPAGRDRVPQFQGAAGAARPAQGQGGAGRRDRCRQRSGRDRRGRGGDDRGGREIRAEEQHRRDHQLRHGADAARHRGGQARRARRRREDWRGSGWDDVRVRVGALRSRCWWRRRRTPASATSSMPARRWWRRRDRRAHRRRTSRCACSDAGRSSRNGPCATPA